MCCGVGRLELRGGGMGELDGERDTRLRLCERSRIDCRTPRREELSGLEVEDEDEDVAGRAK